MSHIVMWPVNGAFQIRFIFGTLSVLFFNVSCLWLFGSGSLRKIIKGWRKKKEKKKKGAFMTTKLQSIVCVSALNISIIPIFWVDLQTKEKEKIKIKQLKKTSKQNREKTPAEATVCHFLFLQSNGRWWTVDLKALKGWEGHPKKKTCDHCGQGQVAVQHCPLHCGWGQRNSQTPRLLHWKVRNKAGSTTGN